MSLYQCKIFSILLVFIFLVSWGSSTLAADIVHDAEYYILKVQHGEKWAAEDTELKAKLAALREKYDAPPNIVHIMWDDTPWSCPGFVDRLVKSEKGHEKKVASLFPENEPIVLTT